MRGDTFIDYERHKGFWINESFMEIFCNFISQAFEKKGLTNKPEWYIELYEDINDTAKGLSSTYLVILFEDYLENKADREIEFVNILKDTKSLIQQKGKEIGYMELRKLEENKYDEKIRNKWTVGIQTKDLIALTDILISMINHEWESKDYRVEFEGF